MCTTDRGGECAGAAAPEVPVALPVAAEDGAVIALLFDRRHDVVHQQPEVPAATAERRVRADVANPGEAEHAAAAGHDPPALGDADDRQQPTVLPDGALVYHRVGPGDHAPPRAVLGDPGQLALVDPCLVLSET